MSMQNTEVLLWDKQKLLLEDKLGNFVQYLQTLVCNKALQPNCYIDASTIFPYILNAATPEALTESQIQEATVPLEIIDAIPTVNGLPFWERLEGETINNYKIFKLYRDMRYVPELKTGRYNRSLMRLASETKIPGRHLNILAKIYHWQARVTAFDTYQEIEKIRLKQAKQEQLEDRHAKMSNKLLESAVTYLLEHTEQLEPKTATDLAKLAMECGRLSVGLYPNKPGGFPESNTKASQAAQFIINNQNIADAGGNGMSGNSNGNSASGINGEQASPMEQKIKKQAQDVENMQSVLHILKESGALEVVDADVISTTDAPEDEINTTSCEEGL